MKAVIEFPLVLHEESLAQIVSRLLRVQIERLRSRDSDAGHHDPEALTDGRLRSGQVCTGQPSKRITDSR